MAWRIDEAVTHGEIDNRVRGRVTGRIWFLGRMDAVQLDLSGDGWRDLAGRRLEFVNPAPRPGLCAAFAAKQKGRVGDITASRKVRVPDIPREKFAEYARAGKSFPWHWSNALYLEWFSENNGRVVIESADFDLKIIGEPTWEMTPREENQQRAANGREMNRFMNHLNEALDEAKARAAGEEEDSDPPDLAVREDDDAWVDELEAQLNASPSREDDTAAAAPERMVLHLDWLDGLFWQELSAIEDRAVAMGDVVHLLPVAGRGRALALRLVDDIVAQQSLADDASPSHPLAMVVNSVVQAATTLMSILDAEDWPPPLELCDMAIFHLTFARRKLDEAERALITCEKKFLVARGWLEEIKHEVTELREETHAIITELRILSERGFE